MRGADFTGIVNGLDTAVWDPAKDPHVARKFSAKSPAGRADCKADLQRFTGLNEDPAAPLLGMVSRLDSQKGIDLALAALDPLLEEGVQAVFLGRGDPEHQAQLETLSKSRAGKVFFSSDFNEALAHKIYAGADIFLMPSRFEPCGLGQLIALRYGCVPVVTPTGGLLDTVEAFDPVKKTGTGFVARSVEDTAYRDALGQAVALLRSAPAAWKALQTNGMRRDSGWGKSVGDYVALYQRALERKRERSR